MVSLIIKLKKYSIFNVTTGIILLNGNDCTYFITTHSIKKVNPIICKEGSRLFN